MALSFSYVMEIIIYFEVDKTLQLIYNSCVYPQNLWRHAYIIMYHNAHFFGCKINVLDRFKKQISSKLIDQFILYWGFYTFNLHIILDFYLYVCIIMISTWVEWRLSDIFLSKWDKYYLVYVWWNCSPRLAYLF